MGNIVVFDKGTKRIIEYRRSRNLPDYDGRDDVVCQPPSWNLIEESLTGTRYLVVNNNENDIREMTTEERNIVDAELAAEAEARKDIDRLEIIIKAGFLVTLDMCNRICRKINISEVGLEQFRSAVKDKIDSLTG